MSVTTTSSRISYNGNGITTVFSFPYKFLSTSDLKVYVNNVLLTLTTDYTVGTPSDSGANVTFVTPPMSGTGNIVILRDVDLLQSTDLPSNGPFPAESVETMVDKAMLAIQRLSDRVSRALSLSDSDSTSASTTLPTPSANKSIKWSSDALSLVNSTNDPDQVVTLAQGYATAAGVSATSASTSASSALSSLNSFLGVYYGSAAADPTLDPLGNPPTTGDLYFNSSTLKLRIYGSSSWQDTAVASPASFTSNIFSGTGAQTAFTLSSAPASLASIFVFVSGVAQRPTTDYTISGTTLTFVAAPPSGSSNVLAFVASSVAAGTPDDGSVSTAKIQNSAVTLAKLSSDATPASKHTVWIPAGAMISRSTNGAASGTVETTTNKVMFKTLDFDTTTAEYSQFAIQMPKSWNEGTVTFRAVWSHAATTVNFGVAWSLQGVAMSDNDAGDAAFGTKQTVTDTGGTTNNIYISAESAAITIAGTPQTQDWVVFQIERTVGDAGDTMAIDARLHGIQLFFTTDAGNDA